MLNVEKMSECEVNEALNINYKIECHDCGKFLKTKVALIDHLKTSHLRAVELRQETFNSYEGNYNRIYRKCSMTNIFAIRIQ